jgi:subtilisin family serine protease
MGSTTATNNISGTSMATPHVAGLIAYLISLNGNTTPAAMSTQLKNLATKDVLTGIRELRCRQLPDRLTNDSSQPPALSTTWPTMVSLDS